MPIYKPNSTSFNKLLKLLDKHNAKAAFLQNVMRSDLPLNTIRHDEDSPSGILKGGFVWSHTSEGHLFWENICNDIEALSL